MKPSLLLHLVRKDIHAFRAPLILMWVAMLWMAFVPITQKGAKLSGYLFIAAVLLLVLVQVQAQQLDPVEDSTSFLKTRPVPPSALVFSKWLLLLSVGLLPLWIIGTIQIVRADIGMTPKGYLWVWTRELMIFTGFTGFVSIFAAKTRNFIRFLGALLMSGAILVIIHSLLDDADVNLDMWWLRLWLERIILSDETIRCLAFAVFGIMAYTVVWVLYLRRRYYWHLLTVAAGITAILLVTYFWSVSFVPNEKATAEQQAKANKAIEGVTLKYVPAPKRGWEISHVSSRLYSARAKFEVENLPENYFLSRSGWSSTFRLVDGSELSSKETFDIFWGVPPHDAAKYLGISSEEFLTRYKRERTAVDTPLFLLSRKDLDSRYVGIQDVQNRGLAGEVLFDVYEPCLEAELPLSAGASHTGNGYRIHIVYLKPSIKPSNPALKQTEIMVEAIGFNWGGRVRGYAADPSNQAFAWGSRIVPRYDAYNTRGRVYPAGFQIDEELSYFSFTDKDWKESPLDSTHQNARLYLFDARRVASRGWPFDVKDLPVISNEAGKP